MEQVEEHASHDLADLVKRIKAMSSLLYVVLAGGFAFGVWVTTLQLGMADIKVKMGEQIQRNNEDQKRREDLAGTLSKLETNSENQTKALNDLSSKFDRLMERVK